MKQIFIILLIISFLPMMMASCSKPSSTNTITQKESHTITDKAELKKVAMELRAVS